MANFQSIDYETVKLKAYLTLLTYNVSQSVPPLFVKSLIINKL